VSIVQSLRDNHPEWTLSPVLGGNIGFAYDGYSTLFTSKSLNLPDLNDTDQPLISEVVKLTTGEDSRKYLITLTEVSQIQSTDDLELIRALDISILQFAKFQQIQDFPDWYVSGSKAFRSAAAHSTDLGNLGHKDSVYKALKGYYVGIKSCLAGLVLVCDLSVTCFLAAGEMINLMWQAGGFRNFTDFYQEARGRGISRKSILDIQDALKGAKIKTTHNGHWRKAKLLGAAANSNDSRFDFNGSFITVQEYFLNEFKVTLRYPELPCVNTGTKQRPLLTPPELVLVPGGQNRSSKIKGEMTVKLIKLAAARPDDRFNFLTDSGARSEDNSIVNVLRSDPTALAFGIGNISNSPIQVGARLLPQAKLKYGGSNVLLDPKLSGSWNLENRKFHSAPPNSEKGIYYYGIIVVGTGNEPNNLVSSVEKFGKDIERDGESTGCRLKSAGDPMVSADAHGTIIVYCSFL